MCRGWSNDARINPDPGLTCCAKEATMKKTVICLLFVLALLPACALGTPCGAR